jgi:SAM-dependent methyltransferase
MSDAVDEPEIVSNGGRDADGSARMLGRWTFEYTPAREIVREEMTGRVLNACAGKTILQHDGEIVRNDLNPDRPAEIHVDVADIAAHFEPQSFDTVLFDPPFDEKQSETKYDGLHASDVTSALEQFNQLVRPGGKVICFGWNSWGMRSWPAFDRSRTTLLQRGPIHRDVIVTVDVRTAGQIAEVSAHE